MTNEETHMLYKARFRHFIREIIMVSKMKPAEKYIWRIMDGVPFKDLETALMMARMDYKKKAGSKANDNIGT